MALTATVQVRVDADIKKAADALFTELGFDTPTAIRMFLSKAVQLNGLPFDVGKTSETANTEKSNNSTAGTKGY